MSGVFLFPVYFDMTFYQIIENNTPIKIYKNKTENRVIFKIKVGFILNLLTLVTEKVYSRTEKIIQR